jgi:two-component system phosphate regulon sensor histidine kinase PhoR
MVKNPTPRQIAFLSSMFITSFVFILALLFLWAIDSISTLTIFPLYILLVFILTYFTIIYYLKKYIYRKIKVIYKSIHKHKVSSPEKARNMDISTDIIHDVEREVEEWADSQKKELDKYKSWADYRRKFLGDISHELKTPIFNIQGYIHSLLDGGLHDDNVNVHFLNKAATNLERLNTIVEDLEAISRLESGELILDMQSFDIKQLTQEVFEDLEFKAMEQNIQLDFKEGASQSFKVRADRESVRQVLMNLINNSIKYGKENGHTRVGFYDMDRYILIEVADDGIGIAKKHLNHVFDRFYRADKSRSRAQGGSGLGLSIVKHIIEAHKQTIHVRSTPKLGSTFGFTLEKA